MGTILVWIHWMILQEIVIQCPSNPTRYKASLSLDVVQLFEWLMAHIIFHKTFFIPHCCKTHFSSIDHSLKKWVIFCFIWAENHKWKCSLLYFFFFLLIYEVPNYHCNSHLQVFSNALQSSYKICTIYLWNSVMWPGIFLIWSTVMTTGLPKHFWFKIKISTYKQYCQL